jgi:hypothetical protein
MGDINGLTCAKRISKRFELLDFGIIPKSCTYVMIHFNSPLTFDIWKEGKKKKKECNLLFLVLIMEFEIGGKIKLDFL